MPGTVQIISYTVSYFILIITQFHLYYYYLQFTDEDKAIGNLNNMPEVSPFPIKTDNVVLTLYSESQFLRYTFLAVPEKLDKIPKVTRTPSCKNVELALPERFHKFKMNCVCFATVFYWHCHMNKAI